MEPYFIQSTTYPIISPIHPSQLLQAQSSYPSEAILQRPQQAYSHRASQALDQENFCAVSKPIARTPIINPMHTVQPTAPPVSPQSASEYNYAPTNNYHTPASSRRVARLKRNTLFVVKLTPTVVHNSNFNASNDAEVLQEAIKGYGADKNAIISILSNRNNQQRQKIAKCYKILHGRDLIKQLQYKVSGKCKDLIAAMMTPIVDYYVKEIHDSISVISTDKDVLIIIILCTLSNQNIHQICASYKNKYGKSLESDIRSNTSGHFERLLVSLCNGQRDQSTQTNKKSAKSDAKKLHSASTCHLGTNEFNKYGKTLGKSISKREGPPPSQNPSGMPCPFGNQSMEDMSMPMPTQATPYPNQPEVYPYITTPYPAPDQEHCSAIRKAMAQTPPISPKPTDYYVKEIHDSISGVGTDKDVLIITLCTLRNQEIHQICANYKNNYGNSLKKDIRSNTSGHLKTLLVLLCNGQRDESKQTNKKTAKSDATRLHSASTCHLGTNEFEFSFIFAQRNVHQLRLIFQEYSKLYEHDISTTICREFSGYTEKALITIVKWVENSGYENGQGPQRPPAGHNPSGIPCSFDNQSIGGMPMPMPTQATPYPNNLLKHPSQPLQAQSSDPSEAISQPSKQAYPPSASSCQDDQLATNTQFVGKLTPTVLHNPSFNAPDDAEALRRAMNGFETDKYAIISMLSNRNNQHRQNIVNRLETLHGRDIIKELKSKLSDRFKDLIVAMMTPIIDYYVKEIHDSISGISSDKDVLIIILCTLSNHDIHQIRASYENKYGKSLESDIRSNTSGHFERLLVSLCNGQRDQSTQTNKKSAKSDAKKLHSASTCHLGTNEFEFNFIFAQRNVHQLRLIFQEYSKLYGHDISTTISREFSGNAEEALLTIVECVKNSALYFAEQLNDSMAEIETKDQKLIFICVTRSEVDMGDIKEAFYQKYGKTLEKRILENISGDFKKCLIELINLNSESDYLIYFLLALFLIAVIAMMILHYHICVLK
ncbi:annexin A6-like [Aphidius gifuensis]|uniref:annexin A6-like n=1 Tax=Aphidius gifuensis TaxID=684658 RepID=UPI001CDD2468|nr:annexin A6-like [Aphidius gifuensis]